MVISPKDVTADYSKLKTSRFYKISEYFPHIRLYRIRRRPSAKSIIVFFIFLPFLIIEYSLHPPQTWWIFLGIAPVIILFSLRTLVQSYRKRKPDIESERTFDLIGFFNLYGFNQDLSYIKEGQTDAILALGFNQNIKSDIQQDIVSIVWVNSNLKSLSSWLHFIFLMSMDYFFLSVLFIIFIAERNTVCRLDDKMFLLCLVLAAFLILVMNLWWLNNLHRWLMNDLPQKANDVALEYNVKRESDEFTKTQFIIKYKKRLAEIDRVSTVVLFMQAITLMLIPVLKILLG